MHKLYGAITAVIAPVVVGAGVVAVPLVTSWVGVPFVVTESEAMYGRPATPPARSDQLPWLIELVVESSELWSGMPSSIAAACTSGLAVGSTQVATIAIASEIRIGLFMATP